MIESVIAIAFLAILLIAALVKENQKTKTNKSECDAFIKNNLEIYNAEPLFYNALKEIFDNFPPCNKCGNQIMQLWNYDYGVIECRCKGCKKKYNLTDKISQKSILDLNQKIQNFYTLMNKLNYLFGKNSGSRGLGWEELKNNLNFDYTTLRTNTPFIRAMLFKAKGTSEIIEKANISTPSRRVSQKTKDMVWKRDEGKCVECGSKEKLEFDHIIPHSKGGSNTYRNVQLLCEPCNRKKSNGIG